MSSVLETFFILFQGDASGLEKTTQQVKKSTEELTQSLKATDVVGSKVGTALSGVFRSLGGLVLGALSTGAIIAGIKSAADYANGLDRVSKSLGVSTEKLDVWGRAVEQSGGSASGFQQTLKQLQTNDYFQHLGRQLTGIKGRIQDATVVFPKLAELFEKLGNRKSKALGEILHLDEGTILLLQKGRREVEAMIARQKELGFVSKQDAEIAAKYNEQWKNTETAFRSLFMTIGGYVLPIFTQIGKVFETVAVFVRKHSGLIEGGLIAIGSVIAYFVTPAIIGMVAAAAPFLVIGAVIAGIVGLFALIYDDIKTFEEGGDSILGRIIEKFPIVGNIYQSIKEGLKQLKDLMLSIPEASARVWQLLVDSLKAVMKWLTGAVDTLIGAYDKVKSFLGLGKDTKATVALENATKALDNTNTPIASQTSNSILAGNSNSEKNVNVTTGPIEIHTQATDANGIAADTSKAFTAQLRQAVNHKDDGLAA